MAVGWLCWIGMAAISAGEIVAWKVPLDRYSYQPEPGKRLESPPEASPFFGPGDELRDAGKPQGKNAPEVEWAVWNETTGTLVTKSNLDEIWPLFVQLDPAGVPRQCRLRIEVFETTGEAPLPPDAAPAGCLEWIAKSGGKSSAAKEVEGKRIEAEVELTLDESGEAVYLSLEGSFLLPGQDRLKIKSQVALKSGSSAWVAGDRTNGKGMEVKVSASTVLMDGTPLTDTIRMQKEGRAISFYQPRHSFERHRIDGKMWLCTGPADLEELLPTTQSDETDPFAKPAAEEEKPTAPGDLKAVKLPGAIAGRFQGPVLDIRDFMVGIGMNMAAGVDFAGYDVIGKTVVFLTPSDSEADKMEQLLKSGCHRPLKNVSASCEDAGKIHVMSRSSQTAFVARGADNQNPVRRFDLEPVIGESGFLELKFRYHDQSSRESPVLLDTSVIVEDGRPVEVLGGGREIPLKMKGTVVEQ